MTSINTANINFKWDPKSLEIRTLAVERLLEPLVTQVSKLLYLCVFFSLENSSVSVALLHSCILTDAFIRSYTFDQYLHSLGIKPTNFCAAYAVPLGTYGN